MTMFAITHPVATISNGIEEIRWKSMEAKNIPVKLGYWALGKTVALVAFPIFAALELTFKRIPRLLKSIPFFKVYGDKTPEKFNKNIHKALNLFLAIIFSPLAIRSADAVSGLFLKRPPSDKSIRPFGVEEVFGQTISPAFYPQTVEELQQIVLQAERENKQISIVGSGMSQGTQTVPAKKDHVVINMKRMNQINLGTNNDTAIVGAGTNWEQIQLEANKRGKSVIVKQASDIFSVGGSIGINCHGWAHQFGAISSTVESLVVMDAQGKLHTLTPKDELFGGMFGTLGYLGIVVSATLKLTNNEHMIEQTEEVDLDEFMQNYKNEVKNKDVPLFGGRLVLDNLESNPLRKVCMVKYIKDPDAITDQEPVITADFKAELKYGTRMERIALQLINQTSYFTARRILSWFWNKEKVAMFTQRKLTRNEALHPPINAFKLLRESKLHAQWLQEYFIKEEHLPNFLRYLGAQLKANDVRLVNATIRPTPKDEISVLPYAEQDRYAVVICFDQLKTAKMMQKTKEWIEDVTRYLVSQGDVYYQAYMPYATQAQFEACYGAERVQKLRELKQKFDPKNRFGNAHTHKYFDKK